MKNNNSKDLDSPAKVTQHGGVRGINWGNSIVIAFALFIAFILYFVIKVQTDSKYDNELVVEEYYKHDVYFQDEMIRIQNAHDLKNKPIIKVDSDVITIVFPADFIPEKVTGNVALYRPSDKKFDFQVPIALSDSSLSIPKSKLIDGVWVVNMEWQYNGKSYLTKEEVYVKAP